MIYVQAMAVAIFIGSVIVGAAVSPKMLGAVFVAAMLLGSSNYALALQWGELVSGDCYDEPARYVPAYPMIGAMLILAGASIGALIRVAGRFVINR